VKEPKSVLPSHLTEGRDIEGLLTTKGLAISIAESGVQHIDVAATEGIVHLRDDGPGLVTRPAADPEAHGFEAVAREAGQTAEPDLFQVYREAS
jgi:hypothetical protein